MDPQIVQYPTTTTVPTNHQHNLPGSPESTPRSASQAVLESWPDDLGQLAQVPGGAKLRLMCSYGGYITPRPHDKSLCYVGGETRMITVERNSSLSEICTRLSRSVLDGRGGYSLKYQLPNEDLDSLISVATDEDLENMVEEYDRLMAGKVGRLRLFIFLAKPETAKTMGVLLEGVKSETWFVDALNGADLNRGLSESAAIDDLLGLGSDSVIPNTTHPVSSQHDVVERVKTPTHQDVHSIQTIMPDAPTMETTTSSFDSSTSSPSMAHLPPIRVRAEKSGEEATRGPTIEEQFLSQLIVTPPIPTTILSQPTTVTNGTNTTGTISASSSENNLNRAVVSDDEKSEHAAAPVVSRKPPLPLPLLNVHPRFLMPSSEFKYGGGYDLPSPDSVKSDCSMASTKSQVHQEYPSPEIPTSKPNTTIDTKTESSAPQDPNAYLYPPPLQQQQHQYIQSSSIHCPIPHYYPVCQAHHPTHPHLDQQQQYPTMYYLPVTQTPPFNLAVQSNEPTRPGGLIQVNPNPTQFHQQYVNYGNYEYGQQQQQQQMYYTGQVLAGTSQYQTITPAQAATIAEANMQLPATDNNNNNN